MSFNNSKEIFGEVYNVGAGKNISILDLANHISDNVINIEKRLGEGQDTLADYSKINAEVGWMPTINILDWLIQNQH